MISGSQGTQILRPIALDCLAHPSSVAPSKDGSVVYVAEMLKNRVLRFIQKPKGVYISSVFIQLSG
ncbi:unnamed protein product, partial [Symbiodinium sp. KB8]